MESSSIQLAEEVRVPKSVCACVCLSHIFLCRLWQSRKAKMYIWCHLYEVMDYMECVFSKTFSEHWRNVK